MQLNVKQFLTMTKLAQMHPRHVTSRFSILCPFHKEKTPSFSIDTELGQYRCFGCGVNGDLENLLINYDVDKEELKITLNEEYIPYKFSFSKMIADNWHEIMHDLELTGLTKVLFRKLVFRGAVGNTIFMHCDLNSEALIEEKRIHQIEEQLRILLECPIKLEILCN